jgi:hypothetical protein
MTIEEVRVGMMMTSIAMTQTRLQDRPRPRQMRVVLRRGGRLGQIEVVLHQGNHQLGVIAQAGTLDRLAGAETAGGIGTQGFELLEGEVDGYGLF